MRRARKLSVYCKWLRDFLHAEMTFVLATRRSGPLPHGESPPMISSTALARSSLVSAKLLKMSTERMPLLAIFTRMEASTPAACQIWRSTTSGIFFAE